MILCNWSSPHDWSFSVKSLSKTRSPGEVWEREDGGGLKEGRDDGKRERVKEGGGEKDGGEEGREGRGMDRGRMKGKGKMAGGKLKSEGGGGGERERRGSTAGKLI